MTASANILPRLMRHWPLLLPSTVIPFIHVFQAGVIQIGASHWRVLSSAPSTSRWTRSRAVSVMTVSLQPFHTLCLAVHGFPCRRVNVHAFNFTGRGGRAKGKRHVFAVRQFHGNRLPSAKLQLQEGVLAVVEVTGGKVRIVNVFLSDDFHKMVGRAGLVRRPKCRRRSP